ncbi:DUF2971 domain-containing protein [Aliivibrio fischeri]|uniref:DUF2971 domain-containing protein n=1 Tax=Aliivibrio fischeri TaxID=668 RepID=UPI0002DA2F48|nr:DUF2971 domain-containing protein [Aliivibrio fischeri]OEE15555.1 hypothetical protein A1Q3_16955 [Aliivibrio fischeri ZF-211]
MDSQLLYKYRNFGEYTVLGLENNSFWLPTPSELNDPFDAQLVPIIESISEEEFKYELELFLAYHKKININFNYFELDKLYIDGNPSPILHENVCKFVKCFNDLAKNLGIYSLTETNKNSTMWSHYADEHKGICIGYDTNSLLPISGVSLKTQLLPVGYFDEKDLTRNAYLLYVRSNMGADVNMLIDYILGLMATKSNDWRYEKEWRLLVPNAGKTPIFYNENVIKTITFGLRTPISVKERVKSIFMDSNVIFYQTIRHHLYLGLDSILMDKDSEYWHSQYEEC